MMRMMKRSLLIALAVVALSCGNAGREDPALLRVVRVIDGDTIWVQGSGPVEKIRLLGIDAPEMNYGKGRPECGASDATRALRLRLHGKRIALERHGRDDYGRTLAIVIDPAAAKDRNLNEWLLREGHAEIFRRAQHPDRDKFAALQREAQSRRLGMWRCR
jgi:micrococcal nuclease